MLHLIWREQRDRKDSAVLNWSESLESAYCYESGSPQIFVDTFETVFSLFPIIRAVEKDSRLHPDDNSKTIAIFSALITDRGLLAEQTRDAAMCDNQSRISTVLTYIPKLTAKERHQRCASKALVEVQPLWKGYFQNWCGYDRFGTLLNIFYQQCVHGRKTIGSSVRFPCKCFLDCERKRFKNIKTCLCQQCAFERKDSNTSANFPYKCFCIPELDRFRNDNICPDKQEIAFVELTQIVISCGRIVPALTYFKELAEQEGIGTFNDDEPVLFIRKILPIYCSCEKLWSNHKSEKHYNAKIMAADLEDLNQQAETAMKVYLYLLTAQPIPRVRRRRDDQQITDEKRVEDLTKILFQHNANCGSCRCQTKDEEEIDYFCGEFASRVDADWGLLRGNPFLIFRLWSTRAQSPFVRESKISLETLLNKKCFPNQTWETPEVKRADRDLYAKLLKLCFPRGIGTSAEKAYWYLLEKDGRSGIPISMLCDTRFDKEIQSQIDHCLSYQPIHLYLNFPAGIGQNDLNLWLEQSPSVLSDLRKSLNGLPQSQLMNLRKLFQGLMEKPGKFAEAWLDYVDQVVNQLDYQELAVQFPKLKPNSKGAQKSFCQFLISWLLLQDLCDESRKLLWKTYLQIRNRNPHVN